MALVHEKLYQSRDLSRIDFSEYIETLSTLLFRSFGVDPKQINLKNRGEGVYLTVETAVPCGLMINELVSNCLKHAFPDSRPGEITVQICKEDEPHRFRLAVGDNGIGLPKKLDIEKTDSLGLQLVRTLTQQLNGRLELIRAEPGTEFRIFFSDIKAAEV
jgi:two-component sensor histidine kinase